MTSVGRIQLVLTLFCNIVVQQPRRFLVKRNACENSFRERNQSYCDKKRFFGRKYLIRDKAGIRLEILLTQVQIRILDLCITVDAERFGRRSEASVVYLMFNAHEFEGGNTIYENLSKNLL